MAAPGEFKAKESNDTSLKKPGSKFISPLRVGGKICVMMMKLEATKDPEKSKEEPEMGMPSV